ncbi:hypothetical protein PPL_11518 [Heterostelium album PN500]|uniref:GPR180/TMEM145 transmembrane domain-containing protein n=1 Tax=Heterostelium pallidum (strain ATCC 26659 / Pp 5 / PN500) TaxID=670386 RepID=D3BTM1_HETP5|nr:hypothetical protein PPL_11518 [Heterostelium album PN500]EFA75438.1 hypothetical protein PPL_11518 [Heterostelium album PN500]|eukprot:XP_020427572.1 hypothetical protein PPL_11518 [Heterostelium album PN500]
MTKFNIFIFILLVGIVFSYPSQSDIYKGSIFKLTTWEILKTFTFDQTVKCITINIQQDQSSKLLLYKEDQFLDDYSDCKEKEDDAIWKIDLNNTIENIVLPDTIVHNPEQSKYILAISNCNLKYYEKLDVNHYTIEVKYNELESSIRNDVSIFQLGVFIGYSVILILTIFFKFIEQEDLVNDNLFIAAKFFDWVSYWTLALLTLLVASGWNTSPLYPYGTWIAQKYFLAGYYIAMIFFTFVLNVIPRITFLKMHHYEYYYYTIPGLIHILLILVAMTIFLIVIRQSYRAHEDTIKKAFFFNFGVVSIIWWVAIPLSLIFFVFLGKDKRQISLYVFDTAVEATFYIYILYQFRPSIKNTNLNFKMEKIQPTNNNNKVLKSPRESSGQATTV